MIHVLKQIKMEQKQQIQADKMMPESMQQLGVLIHSPKTNTKQIEANKLEPHELLTTLGLISEDYNSIQEIFTEEQLRFNHFNTICVTSDDYIISQPETWLAAKKKNENTLLTVNVIDIEKDEILRFINAKSLFFRRNHKAKWLLFKALKKHLQSDNKKARQWKFELQESAKMKLDINESIAKITGYSRTSVKEINTVGNYAETHSDFSWNSIGYEENQVSLKQLVEEIRQGKADTSDLTDKGLKKQEQLQLKRAVKAEKQSEALITMNGNEHPKIVINWEKEGVVYTGNLAPVEESPSNAKVYRWEDNGGYLIEAVINFDRIIELQKQKQEA